MDYSPPVIVPGQISTYHLVRKSGATSVFATELDGKRIETSFDTTVRDARISSTASTQFFGFGAGAGNRTMMLAAKGLSVSNAKVQVDPVASGCLLTHEAARSDAIGYESCTNATPFSIGTDLLRRLRIYLAPQEGTIYISRVRAGERVRS